MTIIPASFAIPNFSSTISVPQVSSITHVFKNSTAAYGGVLLAAVTAHIVPIAITVIGLSVALVFLWKKVYGQQPVAAKPDTAPEPVVDRKNEVETAGVSSAASAAPTAQPAAETSLAKKFVARLQSSNIPKLDHAGRNHYETRAREEKVVEKDGVLHCTFDADHEGYQAHVLYPIVGWREGKGKNTYLILNKLEGLSPRSDGTEPNLVRVRKGSKAKI